jgi:hypothetical protein
MKAQLSVEFLVIVILLITVFSTISIPLAEFSTDNLKDVSTVVSVRSFLDRLASVSRQVRLTSGKTIFETYSPCSLLNCSSGLVQCNADILRENPLTYNPISKDFYGQVGNVSINGIDCSSSASLNISVGEGHLMLNITG